MTIFCKDARTKFITSVIKALLVVSFILIPFSEYRNFHYELIASHNISISVMFFLLVGAFSFFVMLILDCKKGMSPFVVLIFMYVIFALGVFVSSEDNITFTNGYMLIGNFAIMLFSFVGHLYFRPRSIIDFIFLYCIAFCLLEGIGIILIKFYYELLSSNGLDIYNPAFVTVVRPHHAATFFAFILLVGIGTCLEKRRFLWLYFIVPVSFIAILETGSRSATWLVVVALISYGVCLLLKELVVKHSNMQKPWPFIVHYWASVIFTFLIPICFELGERVDRSISILSYSLFALLSGDADLIRKAMWQGQIEAMGGSLHNVYADIYYSCGFSVLFLFCLFLLLMIYFVVKAVYYQRYKQAFYFNLSILAYLFMLIGECYANPLFPMFFVWFFFGMLGYFVSVDFYSSNKKSVAFMALD